MMRDRRAVLTLALALAAAPALAGDVTWKKHDINAKSAFESAAAFDVDGDGVLDIVCGDRWYKGPDFKSNTKVRDVTKVGTYYNDFATLPIDANGDGRMDFVTCSYFGKDVAWIENPGPSGGPWTYHEVDKPGPIEAATFVDLTGDGKPEILPNSVNVVVFYELVKPGPTPDWKTYNFGTEAAGHGVGTGDVNGDGRRDLLTPKGWFEAPANPREQTWPFHKSWDLGSTGIEITCKDVNGDGIADLFWGNGHAIGLFWKPGQKTADGVLSWGETKTIDPNVSSVHTQLWADLDGDGRDELISGKRVYAHEIEVGDIEPSVVAYYNYDKPADTWTRHNIFYTGERANAPAKREDRDAQKDWPTGTAGTGLQMMVIDVDQDGDLDLLCPGKSGLYLFENLTKAR